MAKDRAAPFSRKHRRTWIPVVIGMVIIGALNLAVGIWVYRSAPRDAARPPTPPPAHLGGRPAPGRAAPAPLPDAGVDATPR